LTNFNKELKNTQKRLNVCLDRGCIVPADGSEGAPVFGSTDERR